MCSLNMNLPNSDSTLKNYTIKYYFSRGTTISTEYTYRPIEKELEYCTFYPYRII